MGIVQDKVAIVSGISPGMGRDISLALAGVDLKRAALARVRTSVLPLLREHERLLGTAAAAAQLDVVAVVESGEEALRARRREVEIRLGLRLAWLALDRAVGARVPRHGGGAPAPAAPAGKSPEANPPPS